VRRKVRRKSEARDSNDSVKRNVKKKKKWVPFLILRFLWSPFSLLRLLSSHNSHQHLQCWEFCPPVFFFFLYHRKRDVASTLPNSLDTLQVTFDPFNSSLPFSQHLTLLSLFFLFLFLSLCSADPSTGPVPPIFVRG